MRNCCSRCCYSHVSVESRFSNVFSKRYVAANDTICTTTNDIVRIPKTFENRRENRNTRLQLYRQAWINGYKKFICPTTCTVVRITYMYRVIVFLIAKYLENAFEIFDHRWSLKLTDAREIVWPPLLIIYELRRYKSNLRLLYYGS